MIHAEKIIVVIYLMVREEPGGATHILSSSPFPTQYAFLRQPDYPPNPYVV